jgi:hypothetical protein
MLGGGLAPFRQEITVQAAGAGHRATRDGRHEYLPITNEAPGGRISSSMFCSAVMGGSAAMRPTNGAGTTPGASPATRWELTQKRQGYGRIISFSSMSWCGNFGQTN